MKFASTLALTYLALSAILPAICANVTVSVSVASSWSTGSSVNLVFTNTGSSAICGVTFSITLPSGTTISSSWNMDAVSGSSSQYTLPSWVNIAAGGGTYSSTGMNLDGTGTPSASVVSSTACSSSTTTTAAAGTTTTTTAAAGTTTTTTQSATTTTTTAAGTTTTTTSSSSSTSLVVATDPDNAALNSCKESTATGPITAVLNQAITGGEFTFYGAGGTGACGLDSGKPTMSAAASGSLFNSSAQWIAPCTGSQYILNDAICMNKCVKITYTCVGCSSAKTLTVPINNQCPECAENHVDLSEPAFLWLEPQGGTVGVATGATITYIECP